MTGQVQQNNMVKDMKISFVKWFGLLTLGLSSSVFAASPNKMLDDLSSQVAMLWRDMAPVCVLSLDTSVQRGLSPRMAWLEQNMVANRLEQGLKPVAQDRSAAWKDASWSLREQLEKMAMKKEERQALREYYFKLQTQTPNKVRAQLVGQVQSMSESLNIALRKELWKTCYAMGYQAMPSDQMEAALEQRWSEQSHRVMTQVQNELGAFYFYAFRQVKNPELAVFAKTALQLESWTDSAIAAIEQHFSALRLELTQVSFEMPSHSAGEPFLEDRPWTQEPSPSPFQP